MTGKARATRWRAKQVAEGGKPIGVTLSPGAAQALESLQTSYQCSQREAISLALELAAGHPELVRTPIDIRNALNPPASDCASRRMEDMEQRLEQLEAMLAAKNEADRGAALEDTVREAKEVLITFTARQMLEHGERMSRVQLYALARQHNMPVQPTQHEYNVFISYHMDRIRDMMRSLKERTQ